MTEVSKVGQTQTAQQAQKAQAPKGGMQPDARLEIREGMRVADVEANGSEAQKLVAAAFDEIDAETRKGDGIYDKHEAVNFNDFRFALDKNKKELRAHNKNTGCTMIIKYNSLEELQNKDNLYMLRRIDNTNYYSGGEITHDYRNKKATYDGVTGDKSLINSCYDEFEEVTFKNSSMDSIDAQYFSGKLNIQNTKNVGTFWDSDTEIHVTEGKEPIINADADSKIEIKRW